MRPIISARNVSKRYRLGATLAHDTLRDHIAHGVKRLLGRDQRPAGGSGADEIWALKEVSFDVQPGDVVGIIGRNGSGKSTLLKVLSQITEPTAGEIHVRGRVASLLEVGTGFHPELSGRENIFLNGAILGMNKAEIKKKFDEIVAFSDLEKFLDTPVKRYSSGMYMRLAFAVAAHLEPEILVIDEVLAVGDAEFQKKCLGKMQDVATKEGRTVLFVSHNMNAVEQLCNRAVLLERGRIKNSSHEVGPLIKDYLFGNKTTEQCHWENSGREFSNSWFQPLRFSLTDENGGPLTMPMRNDAEIWVEIEADIQTLHPSLQVGYVVYSEDGATIFATYHTDETQDHWPRLQPGRRTLRSRFPARFLNEGDYTVELIGGLHCIQWLFQPGVNAPSISLRIRGGLSDSPMWLGKRAGLTAPVLHWMIK